METMNETKEIKITMGEVKIDGTGRVGYLPKRTRYSDICKVFGMPQYLDKSSDGKTQAEWQGKINDLIFTIYDYKSEVELEKNEDWHIGGHKEITADLVITYFKVVKTINKRKDNEITMA
jgi:hypothetical protein